MDPETKREFKDQLYEAFVAKALGNGRRLDLELLDLLSQAERRVEELAGDSGMSVANASQHLKILREAGLVAVRREGVRALCRLASDDAYRLWRILREFAEAELPAIDHIVDTYVAERGELEAVSAAELRARLEGKSVILLDVRPANEYATRHIPGARSMPIDELEERLWELPDDTEIVAYCRGRYCVYSDDAVRLLRDQGFRARRLELGVREWERLA